MGMIAYYDLEKNPPSFDTVTFITWVESERRKRNESVEVRILPGPVGGFRRDGVWPHDVQSRVNMRDNVCAPICGLLPDTTVKVLENREPVAQGSIGYNRMSIGSVFYADLLRQGLRPLRTESRPKTDTVTITLRECDHWPQRNSKVDEWVKAAKQIPNCIVIRDTRIANEPLEVATCPEASRSIRTRAELYRSSYCNFFVNNGPAWLCVALDAPMVMLRPATEGIERGYLYGRAIYRDMGVTDQLPASPCYQRLVWEDDTADNILQALDEFKRLNG
jgi:hypothetical protein